MQPDIDAQLSTFFEETPQRDFARVMRGYDPHQVNEALKQLDNELRQHRDGTQALQRELSEAHRQLQEQERPTYSGLGSRIEQLLRLAEEQATEILQEARSAANEFNASAKVEAAEARAAAENEAAELRANAKRETDDQRSSAEREADAIKTGARREADELTSTTEREVAKLRATADHEVAEKRAAIERDIAKLRTTTEREVAQLKASSKRERDEILTTSKRQADEMRSQAQRILEESEAQRAQAEAEFDIQLASRREEAERQEAERLAAAQAATQKMVSEAEQRASTAEQRATKASAQAEQTRRDADQHSRQLVGNAKKNADQIVAQAKAQADQLLADTKAEAERHRSAAQRHVDELNKQKESVAAHLAQISQLLGGQMPGIAGPVTSVLTNPTSGTGREVSGRRAVPSDTSEGPGPLGDVGDQIEQSADLVGVGIGAGLRLVGVPQIGESAIGMRPSRQSAMPDEISVAVYLATDDVDAIARVFVHVDELVEALGYDGPIKATIERGSFVRNSWAKIKHSLTSDEVKHLLIKTERAIELICLDGQQAEVDNKIADTLSGIFLSDRAGCAQPLA